MRRRASRLFEGMVTTRFYLDCRGTAPGAPAPLRLVITKNSLRAFVPLNVCLLPSQWDARRQMVAGHPRRAALNNLLQAKKVEVDRIIFRLSSEGDCLSGLRASQIKDMVLAELSPDAGEERSTFLTCYTDWMNSKRGRTREIYEATLRRMKAFCPKLGALSFEDITVRWLEDFDAFLSRTSPSRNARNIHFRNIRTVFNRAIDDEMTQCYPFRRFKLRPAATRKRSLGIKQIRKIVFSPVPEWIEPYRDMWVLSFYLRGINVVDLCRLTGIDADGYVRYRRAKTHREYSVFVEPEARAIIERHRGKGHLLYMLDGHSGYRIWYSQFCNGLRALVRHLNGIEDGVRIDELTSYFARHSWATVAAGLDIPKETIAAGLGHGGNSVTDIYIDFDARKVDAANRRIIDFVLGLGEFAD